MIREDGSFWTPNMEAQQAWDEQAALCDEIWRYARNELYLSMRFLDIALSSLLFAPQPGEGPVSTDGFVLNYHTESLMKAYEQSSVRVNRAYLHMILHCLFCHLDGRKDRAKEYWDLACDIAVEQLIDGMYYRCIHIQPSMYRADIRGRLSKRCAVMNAEHIYRALQQMELSEREYERLVREYHVDDHSGWEDPNGPKSRTRDRQKKWDDNREKMQAEIETLGRDPSDESKNLLEQVRIENRQKYDYRSFLRKFSVMKETMQVDTDSFDYIYYHYGMELYGNMPLIEHLETKEEKKVEDFVIVIDTSLSCSGDLVRRFLTMTYGVLSESESFFRKINVHIIQCDDQVQSDRLITSARALQDYMEHMEIRGQGGTDFRPAFTYVDQLLAQKKFQKLKGLIYFTDGFGIYPSKMPAYETAFVFWREDYSDSDVPPWAIKLVLGPEDMETI